MTISPSTLSLVCALCGADCEAEASFCPHCGSPIARAFKGDDALTGEVIGDGWRLEERIGADALARLFRAVRPGTNQTFTVRVLHDHLIRNRTFAKNFPDAVANLSSLAHPGILRIKRAGSVTLQGQPRLFLLSESFEARNLCAIVQARGLLPIPQVLLIITEVLEALDSAHRQGVVHGCLLPEDILIGATDDGQVRAKVANFVLGRLASLAVPRLISGGSASGTTLYASPELLRGEEPTVHSDIYSLGIILHEQLTGSNPFDSTSCLVTERRHLQQPPIPPINAAPSRGIGDAIQAVVLQALEKEPSSRFPSARAMLQALQEAKQTDAAVPSIQTVPTSQPFRLVGRAEIVDAIYNTALAPVAYGSEDRGQPRGAVAILTGGAGMGKTAILRAVQSRMEGGPVAIVRVDGRRALTQPLEPFTSLARDALGLQRGAPADVVDEVHHSLVTKFHVDPDEVLRLLDRVTGRPSSLELTPDVVEREQVRSLRSFLGRILAKRPTVLLVEDADAMDSASLDLTKDLLEASATLALSVVVTSKGNPWSDWSAGYVSRIQISNLEPPLAKIMLDRRLTGCDVPDDVQALSVSWSKGSPLLVELCALALRQDEVLVDREGKFKAPSTSQDLFGGLRQLVSSCLRGVSPCARRWLHCAAVAGSMVSLDMLEALAPAEPNRDAVLRECSRTGLVQFIHGELVYDNEGVRDVVRAMLADGEERPIHRFVADWMVEGNPARAPREVIAGHIAAAGDRVSAAKLYEEDARELFSRDEARIAARLLARSERLWREMGDEQGLRRVGLLMAEVLLAAGDGKAAMEVLERLERLGPLNADGLRARVVAVVAISQGDWDMAINALKRASDAAVDTLDQEAWFDVEFSLAELLHECRKDQEAESHAAVALELATCLGDSRGEEATLVEGARIAQAATFLSNLRRKLGSREQAREILQNSLRHPAILGDRGSASRLLANLAHASAETEAPEVPLAFAQRAFELAYGAGDRMAASRIAINLGAYQLRAGQTRSALDSFERAKKLARAIGWSRGVRLSKSAIAKIHHGG